MPERIKPLQSLIRRSCRSRSANIAIWWALVCKCWHHRANSRAFCGDQCRKRGLGSTVCAATVHSAWLCALQSASILIKSFFYLAGDTNASDEGQYEWMNVLLFSMTPSLCAAREEKLCATPAKSDTNVAPRSELCLFWLQGERGSWNRVTLSSPVEWRDFFYHGVAIVLKNLQWNVGWHRAELTATFFKPLNVKSVSSGN